MVYFRKPVWHIPLLCVQIITLDDGQRNCPKYVDFHSKNKFEKLVHLVGFIIRKFSAFSAESAFYLAVIQLTELFWRYLPCIFCQLSILFKNYKILRFRDKNVPPSKAKNKLLFRWVFPQYTKLFRTSGPGSNFEICRITFLLSAWEHGRNT